MDIVDLKPESESAYFMCLEEWSGEIREAGNHKQKWYSGMKDRGLRVKLARDDDGIIGGMIQYLPIEHSFAEGKDLYMVYCIWVHGYKEGRGNYQGRGMGKALLEAAEEDVRRLGSKGIAAWGVSLPFFMRASWFKKQGFMKVDQVGIQVLLWKPFADDAVPPRLIRERKKPKGKRNDRVTVRAFINGWCPAQNMTFERAKRASREFGDKVDFVPYDTSEREVFLEWGILDGLFVDGKRVRTGPPPSYEKIRKLLEKRVNRLKG